MDKMFLCAAMLMPVLAYGETESAPITAIDIYKNGNVILTRHITPTSNTINVKPIGRPAHGSVWHNSTAPLNIIEQANAKRHKISFLASPELEPILQEAQTGGGMKVTLYRGGQEQKLYTVEGVYDRTKITLDSNSEIVYGNGTIIATKPIDENSEYWKIEGASGEFDLQYLTRGALWAPSYRIELNEKDATLAMSTEVRNELERLDNVEVNLISGFPTLKFAAVSSFLDPEATIETYASQINDVNTPDGRSSRRNTKYSVMSQSAIIPGSVLVGSSLGGVDVGAYQSLEAGSGNDIHYMPIGKLTLDKNESVMLPLGCAKTEYERFVDWSIEDRRDVYGRSSREGSDKETMELWDAIEFKNPFAFPMTTAPIDVVDKGRILGQTQATWTNPKDKCLLKITPALSVKGYCAEEGSGSVKSRKRYANEDEYFEFHGRRWSKENVTAKLKVKNYRNEKTKVRIRKCFSGEIDTISDKPVTMHTIPARDYCPNVERELVWELELGANGEKEVEIKYNIWVRD